MTKNLGQLPARLRAKIDAVSTASDTGCWLWLGAMRKAQSKQRPLAPVPEQTKSGKDRKGRPRGRPRTKEHYVSNERGVPLVHSPEKGYVVPACREVYAQVNECTYDSIPVLLRCQEDRCVNPAHNVPSLRKVPHTGRKAHHGPSKGFKPPQPSEMTQEQILEALQAYKPRVMTMQSPEGAAFEAGCGVPTMETWKAFIAWDLAHPDFEDHE